MFSLQIVGGGWSFCEGVEHVLCPSRLHWGIVGGGIWSKEPGWFDPHPTVMLPIIRPNQHPESPWLERKSESPWQPGWLGQGWGEVCRFKGSAARDEGRDCRFNGSEDRDWGGNVDQKNLICSNNNPHYIRPEVQLKITICAIKNPHLSNTNPHLGLGYGSAKQNPHLSIKKLLICQITKAIHRTTHPLRWMLQIPRVPDMLHMGAGPGHNMNNEQSG